MKGLLWTSKGVTEIVDYERPVCSDNTMLVQVLYSGLSNGTERNALTGGTYSLGSWPDIFNYQAVVKVIECGKNIKKYKVGDILFSGEFQGYAQYRLLREGDLIVKLPDGFDLEAAALLGVCGVGYQANVRAQTKPCDNVLIMGAGLVGLFTMQGALAHGARVTIADIDDKRLEYARSLGADLAVNNGTDEGRKTIEENGPYSLVFEVTGVQSVVDYIIGPGWNLRPGGESKAKCITDHTRIVMVAGRQNVSYNFNEAESRQLTIIHNTHFTADDLKQLVRFINKGTIKIRPLITRIVPFKDSVQIFDTLRDNPNELLGTVFDWSDVAP
jgi:2-desacetyl-2-hydroxyethyl bacteriochlorophyllide A dehydrogenase